MIKRLIFDVDGTLITGCNFTDTIKSTLKRIGIYSNENMEKFKMAIPSYEREYDNYNRKDYILHFSNALGYELDDTFVNIFIDELKKCIPIENEQIKYTIKQLAQKYELVLLTNYFSNSQMNRLNNMGIGEYFKDCYGEKLIKPNPMSYINACGKNKPEECVMIGDNYKLDIEGASKSGLHTIWVNLQGTKENDFNGVMVSKVEDITEKIINNFR